MKWLSSVINFFGLNSVFRKTAVALLKVVKGLSYTLFHSSGSGYKIQFQSFSLNMLIIPLKSKKEISCYFKNVIFYHEDAQLQ